MKPITKQDCDRYAVEDPYFCGRWSYYSIAQQMALELTSDNVLEIGAIKPLFLDSTTMNLECNEEVDYTHDATDVPWPFEDKQFNCLIALQVWEHLNNKQQIAFSEVIRTSKSAVLSFPLKWMNCKKGDDHYNITEKIIKEWTLCIPPVKRQIVRSRFSRLILAFDFRQTQV